MRVRCSSDTLGGRPPGVPVPFCLEPGEKTEPGATYVRRSEVSTGKNIEGGELALRCVLRRSVLRCPSWAATWILRRSTQTACAATGSSGGRAAMPARRQARPVAWAVSQKSRCRLGIWEAWVQRHLVWASWVAWAGRPRDGRVARGFGERLHVFWRSANQSGGRQAIIFGDLA